MKLPFDHKFHLIILLAGITGGPINAQVLLPNGVTCSGNDDYCNAALICSGYSTREGVEKCMGNMYWSKIKNQTKQSDKNRPVNARNSPTHAASVEPAGGGGCITVGGQSVAIGKWGKCP